MHAVTAAWPLAIVQPSSAVTSPSPQPSRCLLLGCSQLIEARLNLNERWTTHLSDAALYVMGTLAEVEPVEQQEDEPTSAEPLCTPTSAAA